MMALAFTRLKQMWSVSRKTGYTHTRDRDFYTIKMSVDYKNSENKKQSKDVYAELFGENDQLSVIYLTIGYDIYLDNRADVPDTYWVNQPEDVSCDGLDVNLLLLSTSALAELKTTLKTEIAENHTVDNAIAQRVLF